LGERLLSIIQFVLVGVIYFIVTYQIRVAVVGFLNDEFRKQGTIFQPLLDDPVLLKEEMDKQFKQVSMTYPVICRFYDETGGLSVKSESLENVVGTDRGLIEQALRGELVAHTLISDEPPGQYWCVIYNVRADSGRIFIYEFGIEVSSLVVRVRQLRRYLLFAIPVIVLLSLAGAFWIAYRSLKPLSDMLVKLRHIRSATLDKRLPVSNPNDELGHLTITINDMLAEIDNSFSLVRDFTADAAHELRTSLTRILLMLETNLNQNLTIDEARDSLDHILRECQHIKRLIDDLMLLARLEAGDVEGEPVRCDLVETIEIVREMWVEVCEHQGVAFETNIDDRLLMVKGYPEFLTRLLANLIDNALRHSPADGLICVSGSIAADHIQITVSDTGSGIAGDKISRLFKRFYSVQSEIKPDQKGTGLGLSICDKITQLHRGSIKVTSTMGEGTLFTIKIPRFEGEA